MAGGDYHSKLGSPLSSVLIMVLLSGVPVDDLHLVASLVSFLFLEACGTRFWTLVALLLPFQYCLCEWIVLTA